MAQAITLNQPPNASYADTALPGTTLADRPELVGTVLETDTQGFSFHNNSVRGNVHSQVVLNSLGTLDFYWRIVVDPNSSGKITALRMIDFGFAFLADADWLSDGPSSTAVAPPSVRLFGETRAPTGAINFLFGDQPVDALHESPFFFLHTNAITYTKTAQYELLCTSGNCQLGGVFSTFAPLASAVPEPATYAMLALGLALTGFVARRRKTS